MKKHYITPEMEAYSIKAQQLLAGSDVTISTGTEGFGTDGFGSRDFELDDDFMMKQLGL